MRNYFLLHYIIIIMFFENAYIVASITPDMGKSDLHVKGFINEFVDDNRIHYLAAAPADYRYSFHGSGLPFANPKQAFQHTPNKGVIELQQNQFEIKLRYPNSYYVALGTVLVPPTLTIEYLTSGERRVINIEIANSIPFRLLTYPKSTTYVRDNPLFYKGMETLPVRTQEQILRDAGYPEKNKTPKNFWGLKPPC
jgi:hypothetical protein